MTTSLTAEASNGTPPSSPVKNASPSTISTNSIVPERVTDNKQVSSELEKVSNNELNQRSEATQELELLPEFAIYPKTLPAIKSPQQIIEEQKAVIKNQQQASDILGIKQF